jgi:hypothetical protein
MIAYLLVNIELSENLGGIKQVCVVNNPGSSFVRKTLFYVAAIIWLESNSLLNVVSEERQVEDKGNPVSVDQEQKGQEAMDGGFGQDVGVEAVAEVDGVDVVAAESRVSHGQTLVIESSSIGRISLRACVRRRAR